ncbi:MAG: iron-containing alcohol dehydrogenase family protein [Firmicutes bacterium]|nr:iron-containing alcohol dehydrogenase family protein [Bacillota bacterium]
MSGKYEYFMPTRLFFGGSVREFAAEFAGDRSYQKRTPSQSAGFGRKALIVTGKSSAKNGALDDAAYCLSQNGLEYAVFDRTEENPSLENADEAAKAGLDAGCDCVVAIGGGSPMDLGKAAAVLLANPDKKAKDLIQPGEYAHVPLYAVPTTAGTGSETTPYSILTLHEKQTKSSIGANVFFGKAFLCARYTDNLPEAVTLSAAVDVLAHLCEGYLSSKASPFSDMLAEGGFASFAECVPALKARAFDAPFREKMLRLSSLAGVVIAQARTSLPHAMGYAMTYFKHMPHGFGTGILLGEYLKFHPDREKVGRFLRLAGFASADGVKELVLSFTERPPSLTPAEIEDFSRKLYENKAKLAIHPGLVELEDIREMYRRSTVTI